MGIEQCFVAVYVLVSVGIHQGCLQVQLGQLWACGGQKLAVQLIEVEVGEEGGGILLQDVVPSVARGGSHQRCEVEVVAHLDG